MNGIVKHDWGALRMSSMTDIIVIIIVIIVIIIGLAVSRNTSSFYITRDTAG